MLKMTKPLERPTHMFVFSRELCFNDFFFLSFQFFTVGKNVEMHCMQETKSFLPFRDNAWCLN